MKLVINNIDINEDDIKVVIEVDKVLHTFHLHYDKNNIDVITAPGDFWQIIQQDTYKITPFFEIIKGYKNNKRNVSFPLVVESDC